MPFLTEGNEGVDINDAEDWWYAEHLLSCGEIRLPEVAEVPFPQD
jgi:N-acylneuraminate cytidylyltransferase